MEVPDDGPALRGVSTRGGAALTLDVREAKFAPVGETEERVRYDLMAPRPPEGEVDLESLWDGAKGPIELDIGFGRGASLFERAANAPGSRILGVEIKTKWAYKCDERRKRLGLNQIRVFSTDVRTLLPRLQPSRCVSRVFIHFPDPWWKKRHQHRRVVGHELLDELARLLVPGGDLYVQTDVEERAAEYVEAIRAHPDFVLATDSGLIEQNPFHARSNRERRADEDGLPVYRILAHRRGLATQIQNGRCGA